MISAANNTISDSDAGGIAQGITDTGTGDTLTLNPGTYNKTNQDTNITISNNITIQGNGPIDSVIIDARELSRIFTIANNLNVTFINITFINGNIASNGAVIYNNFARTDMTLINCVFTNNKGNHGGAIYNLGNISVDNCNFNDNNSINGAAIYNSGNIVIINSNFRGNTVTNYGGAISSIGNMTIFECFFHK